MPFHKHFLVLIIALIAALTSFAEEKQEATVIANNSGSLPQLLIEEIPALRAAMNAEVRLLLLPFKPLQSKNTSSLNITEYLQNSNYKLAPISDDLDFLKQVLPIVDQLSILNNRFGVGLGIKLF